jgi:hypothetical protein
MKIKRLRGLGITVIALAGIEYLHPQAAQSKPIPLIDLPCMMIKGGNYALATNFSPTKEDIILNREIYTSLFRLEATSDQEFACKLPNAKNASLDLELTIPSGRGGPFLFTVYLNGNQIISEKVSPGKVKLINEPLTGRADTPYQVGGRRTIVFETTCLSGSGCGEIRFLKGNLNVVSNPGAQ